MTPLINAKGISKHYSSKTLFDNLDLSILDGDRIGLIGANGAGKSTLLNILAQLEEPDDGLVTRKKFLKLGFVKQNAEFPKEQLVIEALIKSAVAAGSTPDIALVEAQIIGSQMEFDNLDAVIDTLSGGWKKRLSIACTLISEPELVIFDEPTNHLDRDGWKWLQNLLSNSTFAWILTSHDRYFLHKTVSKVAELSSLFPQAVLTTNGNYKQHLDKRAEYLEQLASEIQSMSTKMKREDEWLSRGPKARATKSKYRIDAAADLKDALTQAKSRMRTDTAKMDFTGSERQTKKLIEAKKITKAYDGKSLYKDFEMILGPRRRIGVLGPNGSGKSTLLKTLVGEVEPDSGSVYRAPNLQLTYFDQGRDSVNPSWSLKRALAEDGDSVVFQGRSVHVVSWAKRFLFTADQLDIPYSDLSGGEQARVIIARFMLQPSDVLVLDEPTNDLDIPTLEALEDTLNSFPGAIVIVSHDRFLMETVCNGFIGLLPGGGQEFYATYSQWERESQKKSRSPNSRKSSKSGSKLGSKSTSSSKGTSKTVEVTPTPTKKLSYMDQRDYESIEKRIQEAEAIQEELQIKMSDPKVAAAAGELAKYVTKLELVTKNIEELYTRWDELEAKRNS